jgi:pilus assembly protein FimV
VDDPLRAALFEEEAVAEKPAEVSNMLDFDLDADAELAPAPAAAEKPAAEPEAETNLLDFDFNLDGLLASQWPARLSLSRLLPRPPRCQ